MRDGTMKLTFMKSITWKALFVLGISLVLIYGFTTLARQGKYHESLTPPSLFEWTNSEDGLLSVCFTVDKTTFDSNEAFSIRCAIRNNTDKPLTILRPFGDEFYSLSSGLYILGPTGQITYHGPWKEYVLALDSFYELRPHTIIDETLKIPDELFAGLRSPGLYKIAYTYQSSGYPKKIKPANFWEGKVIGDSVILLRQASEAPNVQSDGEEVQLTCSMTKVEFEVGEKLPPPKVTVNNNTNDPVDLIGPTLTVISCRLVQPDATIVRMCLAMPTGLDPRRMPRKKLEPKSKINFTPVGIWYLKDGRGYEPYVFMQEGTYKFQCHYEQLISNTLKLKVTKRPSKLTDAHLDSTLPKDTAQPRTSDLNKAVSIAVAKLSEKLQSPAKYNLIGAHQIYYKGKYVWRITFKPTKLFPADPSTQLIGQGGEVFMNIDLKTKETVMTYGE